MNSSPRFARARDIIALVNAIDDATADPRQWPAVVSNLTEDLPLNPAQLPQALPSGEQAEALRHVDQDCWSQEHAEILEFACAQLVRAAKLHERLADMKLISRAVTKALNRTLRAIVVVDKASRLLAANAAADEILGEKDGLCVDGNRLRASVSDIDTELRRCIHVAASRMFRWVAYSVPRASGSDHLRLVLSPAQAMMRSGDREDFIVITISCPTRKIVLDPDVLCRLYALTRSEAKLACRIASGDTLDKAAEYLGISNNTARTHLKRIFMKTDTSRQSQLVLLLAQHADQSNAEASPTPATPQSTTFFTTHERRRTASQGPATHRTNS